MSAVRSGAAGQAFLAERQPIRRKHALKAFGIAWLGRPVNCQHACHDLTP
jgi:hypothetical protein